MATRVQPTKQPFMGHVQELRQRLMWWALSVVIGGGFGYLFRAPIQALLIRPLHQPLFYTTPTGSFDFVIQICIFVGVFISIPVFTYNLLRFVEPVLAKTTSFFIAKLLTASGLLVIAGMCFAYFVSLPSTLHFFSNFNAGGNLKSLITTNEYLQFVLFFMALYAALFQLPLILFFINRIRPMRPKKLMKNQRWVIVVSFIVAAVLMPTNDPISQAIMAFPMIALYDISVLIIWLTNRKRFPQKPAAVEAEILRPKAQPAPQLQSSRLLPQVKQPQVEVVAATSQRVIALPKAVAQTVPAAWSRPPQSTMPQPQAAVSSRTIDLSAYKQQTQSYRPSRNIIDMRPKNL